MLSPAIIQNRTIMKYRITASKLSFNVSKTLAMIFINCNYSEPLSIIFNRQGVTYILTGKSLDEIFNDKLRFNEQIKHVSLKCLNNKHFIWDSPSETTVPAADLFSYVVSNTIPCTHI